MMSDIDSGKPVALVLASTYPRWQGDTEPDFVHRLNIELANEFEVHALVPHFRGAARAEVMDGVRVFRFRYQFAFLETLISNGGILTNLKQSPWKCLLLPFFFLAQTWAVCGWIRRLRPDVLHVHWMIPQGLTCLFVGLFVRLPPMVLTSHGGDLFALKGRLFTAIKNRVLRKASLITVVSKLMKERLTDMGVPAEKIRVQSMGVDFEGVYSDTAHLPRETARLLFVGRIVEKKGLEYLLRAMPAVVREHPQAHLHIAGGGPLLPGLEDLVSEFSLDRQVTFLGPKSPAELAILYKTASLFVAPFVEARSGDQEGLGLVTAEAMGMGTPVLVGDVSAVFDVVGEGSDNTVNARDIQALASKINQRLSDIRVYQEKALQCMPLIRKRFSWQAVGLVYSGYLQQVYKQQL